MFFIYNDCFQIKFCAVLIGFYSSASHSFGTFPAREGYLIATSAVKVGRRRGGLFGTPKALQVRLGEPLAPPPHLSNIANGNYLFRTVEDACPYKFSVSAPSAVKKFQKLRSNKAHGTADYEGRPVGFPTEKVLGGSAREPFSKGLPRIPTRFFLGGRIWNPPLPVCGERSVRG